MLNKFLLSGLLLLITTSANAALIPFSFAPSSANSFSTTLATTNVTSSAAVFNLSVAGDFNSASENLIINIEGLFVETVLDDNTSNDSFSFANSDDPISSNAPSPIVSSSTTIAQSIWAQIISDGFINLTFTTTTGVNCCSGPDVNHLSGSFDFQGGTVPTPATLVLMGLGLIGLGIGRKKRS